MALWAIGDLHLSFGADKPMDVFGGAWDGYVDKLCEGLTCIGPEDTTVLLGDLSWALDLKNAAEDFRFIHEHIPGRKIIIKGNHDYWWSTAKKFDTFCSEQGFVNMQVMNNNCFFYEETAICGTRGWFYEEDRGEHSAKIFNRELIRLETSLKAGGDREKICFLHYPPVYHGYRCQEILDLLERYGVTRCYYGHLHGGSHRFAVTGMQGNVEYQLVSADYLRFCPKKILD